MQLKLEDLIKQKNSETVEKYESDFKELEARLKARDEENDRKLAEIIQEKVAEISAPLKIDVFSAVDKMMDGCTRAMQKWTDKRL